MADQPVHGDPYRAGSGPDRLPQGDTAQINAEQAGLPQPGSAPASPLSGGPEQQAGQPPEGAAATPPMQSAGTPPGEPAFTPRTDEERYLFGQSEQPLGHPEAMPETVLPVGWQSWLTEAQAASQMPDAGYWLKAFTARASEASRVASQIVALGR